MSFRSHTLSPVPAETPLTEGFALSAGGRGGRVPFDRDPMLAALAAGAFDRPRTTPVDVPGGGAWEPAQADKDGWFSGPAFRRGGYLYASYVAPEAGVALLAASGHSLVYVNGQLRTGDPYGYGYLVLPVALNKGINTFVLSCSRGRCRATLLPAPAEPALRTGDSTLPDIVAGERAPLWAAIIAINPGTEDTRDLVLDARCGDRTRATRLPAVPACGLRKVGFEIPVPTKVKPGEAVPTTLTLRRGRTVLDQATVSLRVRKPDESHKRTFVSQIDGSVQYYGVRPALKPAFGNALVLTLHGASVEGIGQIDAYGSKDWATLVGPTNRRPYGFDWEDWGRLDALEVLEIARKRFRHDPARTQLTGHSMGGHGTWAIGSAYPDRFAAIGPSAGWISFATYAGGRGARPGDAPDAVDALLRRASADYDTLQRVDNLLIEKVYVLHGDADDNVPVTEARRMKQELEAVKHPSLAYHEQPGAGHWWGGQCVDWKPMFDLFANARIVEKPAEVAFVTTNPAVSARFGWATIVQQEHALQLSRVRLKVDPVTGAVVGDTQNVALLRLDPAAMPGETVFRSVTLDGQSVTVVVAGNAVLYFRRIGGAWRQSPAPRSSEKTPERGGPFKQGFQNRFVLVYGTGGTSDETDALRAKARYDAEQFQYRGNGAVDVIADRDARPRALRDRGVILYGNADTNRAWSDYLSGSPIEIRRGRVRVADQTRTGNDLLCCFVRPRPDSSRAHVAVVGATGAPGQRIAERLPYFVSGVGYPDWVVASAKVALEGFGGVLGAGFFGNDWRVESGDSAWRE